MNGMEWLLKHYDYVVGGATVSRCLSIHASLLHHYFIYNAGYDVSNIGPICSVTQSLQVYYSL